MIIILLNPQNALARAVIGVAIEQGSGNWGKLLKIGYKLKIWVNIKKIPDLCRRAMYIL